MIVRRATFEEVPAAMALAHESFMSAVAPHYSDRGIRTFLDFASPDAMLKRVQENYVVYVAYREERIVGMAATRDGSHIAMLFVAPHAQRKGVGRRLLEFALSECTAEAVTVNASPNSETAYLRFGFRPSSEEKYVDGIRFIPMMVQRKGLNKAPAPTSGTVTGRADTPPAPVPPVAHL